MTKSIRVALASPVFPRSIEHALENVERYVGEARERQARIVCFPESYVPGMRGIDEQVAPHSPQALEFALDRVCSLAKQHALAIILPMDWDHPRGILNVAQVISECGEWIGYQTKNHLDPSEDGIFVPGDERRLFAAAGLVFGITICHEGFRYPESVRWAARRGASIVFHPHCTGSNYQGTRPREWRGRENEYYEHAMVCRALENSIYFAGVNYAFTYQASASCVISPEGDCLEYQPYGEPRLVVAEIDPTRATRLLALRWRDTGSDA